jgi:hypothetical protein
MMRVRARTLALCLGAVAGAAALAGQAVSGCVFDFAGDCDATLKCDGGATSTTGTTSTSSSGTAGSGGAPGCKSASECPGPFPDAGVPDGGACLAVATCKDHKCGLAYVAGDATDQPYGTCTKRVCDANGNVTTVEDPTNVYDAGAPCLNVGCGDAGPTYDFVTDGGPCPPPDSASAQGRCVAGLDGQPSVCAECISAITDCNGASACSSNQCVLSHCTNGLKDSGETAIDCGGADCAPCTDGKACLGPSDCQSGVCDVPPGICAAATCMDHVKNGGETDVDCGGPCAYKCPTSRHCIVPSDCASQVCVGGKCQDPTCSDGVQNGDETGVDCGSNDGGACTDPCPIR